MNNEMTNKALSNAIQIAESEMLRVAQTAMANAYDNILEMLSIQMNNYATVLHDHANVLMTSYGNRFDKINNQKQKVWSTYYKLSEIYGKVAEMRYKDDTNKVYISMIKKIVVKKETAHLLTKVSRKEKWYFRCLTRTDRKTDVVAEIHDVGIQYLNDNNIKYSEDETEE